MPTITIHHVAALACCSVASVSRVVNGTGPASPTMRARVEAVVAELGFRPSELGRSLARKSRRVIGVLVPSTTNPVFAASLAGIQDRARLAGCSVLIAQSDYDPGRETEAVEALLAERPLGLVLTVCDPGTSVALALANRAGVPTVLIFNEPGAPDTAAVTVDNRGASRALVAKMIGLGHRRIAFVAGRFAASDRSRLRYAGFRDALHEAGLAAPDAVEVDFIADLDAIDLTDAMDRLSPTALVVSNDLLALSVIAAVRRLGLDVPGDVSVAGFDGIAIGRLVHPSLATIEQPARTMGVSAAALLFDIAAKKTAPCRLQIDHSIRAGGTLAPPKDQDRTAATRGQPVFQET
jgi:DNA-binding LacI/PurR family transcriptional regulator